MTESVRNHPLRDLIAAKGSVVIDGAMSTALESLGCNLNDSLWSAKILAEDPEKIYEVHRRYYEAGADIAITASYQASEAGFKAKGIGTEKAAELIALSVTLARRARDTVLAAHPEKRNSPLLVAGSVGPYGAYLADGSEYTGNYTLTRDEYRAFHGLRLKALAEAGADLLAIETQPKPEEAAVVAQMAEEDGFSAWVTFSLADAEHTADGTPVTDAVRHLSAFDNIDALGFNCIRQEWAARALELAHSVTDKPLIVYPNSGETYDPATKTWHHPVNHPGWDDFVGRWKSLGARCIGGCCRTLPADIVQIAALLSKH